MKPTLVIVSLCTVLAGCKKDEAAAEPANVASPAVAKPAAGASTPGGVAPLTTPVGGITPVAGEVGGGGSGGGVGDAAKGMARSAASKASSSSLDQMGGDSGGG